MIGHDFPYLDTRDLNLDWLIKNMKQILIDWAEYQQTMNQSFSNLEAANAAFKSDITTAFNNLHTFVDDYFENLNVHTEINNKLNAMKNSGELAQIMNPLIASQTSAWLSTHITNPSNPPIDTSLSVAGAAADAKVTGEIRSFTAVPCAMTATGAINIVTATRHFEIPVSMIFTTWGKTYRSLEAASVEYPDSAWVVLCYDIDNNTYAAYNYNVYRPFDKYKYPWILIFHKSYPLATTCVMPCTVDGVTVAQADNTLAVANGMPNASVVGLIHAWAIGDINGFINFDTAQRTVSVPAGTFFTQGKNNYTVCNSAELAWLNQGIQVLCVNFTDAVYEILAYDVYRTKSNITHSALAVFNRGDSRQKYFASPYAVLVDGKDRNDNGQSVYISDVIGRLYSNRFNASGSHSSHANTLATDIPAGAIINLSIDFANGSTSGVTWVLTDNNNTPHNVAGRGGTPTQYTAPANIVEIGVYFDSVGETSVTVNVQVYGEFQTFRDQFTLTNGGSIDSINGDGVTKTCSYDTAAKKLYIEAAGGGVSVNQQGAAYDNGLMIIATHSLGTSGDNCTLDVWNFENQTRLYTFPVANDEIKHANNVIATGRKIAESDVCSLLMVSDNAGNLCICRLTTSGCTVIHNIPFDTSVTGNGPNFMYDATNGTIVSLGYTRDTATDPNDNPMIVCVWDVTGWDVVDSTPTVTLRYKYTLPHMPIMNGGIIRNGIMYIMCTPFQFDDYTFIAVSPIEAKTITNRWHFTEKSEFENINFVDDKTIIYGAYWFYKASLKTVII